MSQTIRKQIIRWTFLNTTIKISSKYFIGANKLIADHNPVPVVGRVLDIPAATETPPWTIAAPLATGRQAGTDKTSALTGSPVAGIALENEDLIEIKGWKRINLNNTI